MVGVSYNFIFMSAMKLIAIIQIRFSLRAGRWYDRLDSRRTFLFQPVLGGAELRIPQSREKV